MRTIYFILNVFLFGFTTNSLAEIRSYSRVIPDIPTANDSITIQTFTQISFETIIDSALAISGNDFFLQFTATNSDSEPRLSTSHNKIGRLPAGNYRIFTNAYDIRNPTTTRDTAKVSRDTFLFSVRPDTFSPPRITSFRAFRDYAYVGDAYPRRSYFYWNGDTLSIGMAFYSGGTHEQYFSSIGLSSDTLLLDLMDTCVSTGLIMNGYLTITSISPIPQSLRHVRIRKGVYSSWQKTVDTGFYRITANPLNQGIGLSFKKTNTPKFILCPNDTLYMHYVISSPFLDTLSQLGFQPNPLFKTTGTGRIFIHNIYYNDTLIEDWESFDKNDWQNVRVKETDNLEYDTVSNSTNGDHWLRMLYSNNSGDPVKGYFYKALTQPRVSSISNPYVGIVGAVKNPDSAVSLISTPRKEIKVALPVLQVSYSGSNIIIAFTPENHLRSDIKQ